MEFGVEWWMVSQNNVDWSIKKGWYLDLESVEKQVSDFILCNGCIIFIIFIFSFGICVVGGYSWFMEFDVRIGGVFDSMFFDVNGDGYFLVDDFCIMSGFIGSDV